MSAAEARSEPASATAAQRAGDARARRGAGLGWALASAISFGLMSWLVHAGSTSADSNQLALLRGLLGLALLTPFVWRRLPQLFELRARWIWSRSLAGALSILCFFWNLQHTSVGTAKALADLTPLFVAAVSALWLRERLRGRDLAGCGIALAGALVIDLAGASAPSTRTLLVGMLGAVAAAVALLSLREAAQQYSTPLVVWSLCALSTLVSCCAGGWPLPSLDAAGVAIALGVGLSGLAGQLLMTRAYVHLPASIASALGLTALVWAVGFEMLFSGARPGAADWCGYASILLGALLLQRGSRADPDEAGP